MQDKSVVDRWECLVVLLGSFTDRWYRLLLSAVVLAFVFVLCWFTVKPTLEQISEARRVSDELREYQMRRAHLFEQVDHPHIDEQVDSHTSREALAGSERVLELIHGSATQAGVAVTDFSRGNVAPSHPSVGEEEIHFTVRGAFINLRGFLHTLSSYETKFVISAIAIENVKWPDFDGELRARVAVTAQIND